MDITGRACAYFKQGQLDAMERLHTPDIQTLLCGDNEKISAWRHENVFNSWWYLYWNSAPGAFIRSGDVEYKLEPGHFCLIAPETRFSTGHEKPFAHFYIHFTAGIPFDRIKNRIYLLPVDGIADRQMHMLKELLPDKERNPIRMDLLSSSVICFMLSKIDADDYAVLRKLDPRVEAAKSTLDKITSRIISNDALAEDAKMSVNGFIRLFASELGVTPQKYSRRKRIEKASLLLRFTDKKVEEIARETGFLDRYHFSRAFKEITKRSPAEFRASGFH
jgi:AraC-like DNA-binding protein